MSCKPRKLTIAAHLGALKNHNVVQVARQERLLAEQLPADEFLRHQERRRAACVTIQRSFRATQQRRAAAARRMSASEVCTLLSFHYPGGHAAP